MEQSTEFSEALLNSIECVLYCLCELTLRVQGGKSHMYGKHGKWAGMYENYGMWAGDM